MRARIVFRATVSDRRCLLYLLSLTICCLACSEHSSVGSNESAYVYRVPEVTDDGWETASLSSVGFNQDYFVKLMNDLSGIKEHNIHSILVVKDGKLVFEEYFEGLMFSLAQYTGGKGFTRDDKHNLASATKSFTSALVGIAIDKGYIRSVEEKVFDFFPEYAQMLIDEPGKRTMTLLHSLTMTSGLEWDDESLPYSDPRNDMNRLFNNYDPMRYILSKDLFAAPGSVFDYDNCNTNVLGEVIHKATEYRLDKFADRYLFSKLGITDYEWQTIRGDVIFCSGDLRLRPRDMAKFGRLFLDGGMWNGERIVSQEWVDVSTRKCLNPNDYTNEFGWAEGYGYQWWQWGFYSNGRHYSCYMAAGWGGQWIFVFKELNMVVVTTGGNYYTQEPLSIQTMLREYICPAMM